MAYDPQVFAAAGRAFSEQREEHARRQAQRRAEIYERLPQARQLEQSLRSAVPQVLALAFRRGEDPQQAVAAIRARNLADQQALSDLLVQHGYAADALDDSPLCPDCGDRGWQGSRMCHCLRALCTRYQIASLSQLLDLEGQRFSSFSLDYYADTKLPGYSLTPRENMTRVLAVCRKFAATFGTGSLKNLFLYGAPGLGKTYLSACIAGVVAQNGHAVVYDTAGEIFSRFEAEKFSRDAQAAEQTRKYLSCDLLILDDLGSEMTTPFVQAALYQLINQRLVRGLGTVISSNLTMEDVRGRYQPQIASRLAGSYQPLPFYGEDIRLQKRRRTPPAR